MKILSLILLGLLMLSCKMNISGKQDNDNDDEVEESIFSVLNGKSFITDCSVVSGQDQINRMVISSDGTSAEMFLTSYESSDGSCTTETNVVKFIFTDINPNVDDLATGQIAWNQTWGAATLTLSSAGITTVFNNYDSGAGVCGINTWVNGVAENVNGCLAPAVSTAKTGTIWVTGSEGSYVVTADASSDAAGCGATDNSTTELRCVTKGVDASNIYIQE